MVVRLKDLNNDSAPSTKKGVVRLSDLTAPTVSPTVRPVRPTRIETTAPRKPINGAVEMDEAPEMDIETKARQIPVLGHALKTLDYVAEKTEPVAKVLRSFYIPGAGLSEIGGITNVARGAVGAVAERLAPKLANTLGGKVAKTGLTEAIVGAPLGAAQVQMMNPDASLGELGKGAGLGAALGGGLGAVGPLAGRALTRLSDIAPDLARNAIRNVAANTRTVATPFADDAVAGNPIARGYTDNVGRSFGNGPTRAMDDVAAPRNRVIQTPSKASIVSNVEQLNGGTIAEPVIQQPPQVLTRSNSKNQLENGNFSDELQSRINQEDHSYERITNVESNNKALKNVENLDGAEANFMQTKEYSAEHVATGYQLMKKLDRMANMETNAEIKETLFKRALNVSTKLEQDLTTAGQTSQAARILERLSPEGQLRRLIRTAGNNGKTVKLEDSIKFKAEAQKVLDNSGAGVEANEFTAVLERISKTGKASGEDLKVLSDYLENAQNKVKPKEKPIVDNLPPELKQPKKREKVVEFFDNAEQAALARIAARKNRLNSMPFDEWKDHAIVVASQLAKGTIKAATHVEDLVKLFGDEIRPVASQVFQQAQKMVNGVSRSAAEGNLEKANQAFRKLSGQAAAEKEIVKEMSTHVKKLIADAKEGKLSQEDIQKLRDYSDEISEMLEGKPKRILTQEDKFMQSVKSLAKKIAQVENESIPADIANKELSNLLRQVTKIANEGLPLAEKIKLDNHALSDIAHDVMEKTRPHPKPTTLQEKIVEKYIKQNKNVTEEDISSLRTLAKDMVRLSGNNKIEADMAMQKILNSYEKSTVWGMMQALRYIAMLFNTSTQAINAASGPIMSSVGTSADAVFGVMVDKILNKTLKTQRSTTLYGSNPLAFLANFFKGLYVGGKAGWNGVNPAGIQGTNEIRGLAFKSLKNPLSAPFSILERSLGAVAKGFDYATYSSIFKEEIIKQGRLDAMKQGIKGSQNIKNHIERFKNDPPPKAILEADRMGKNTTFQRSDRLGGKTANWLNSAPKLGEPFVKTIFPFVRTPVNIASSAVTLTPGGIIKGLYQLSRHIKAEKSGKLDEFVGASQREAIRNLSLGLTGSGIGVLGYYLSHIGVITGANDTGDTQVNQIREQAGKGKYRFNTSAMSRYLYEVFQGNGEEAAIKAAKYQKGDKQFDYNKLQPLAFPAAIGASLNENKGQPSLEKGLKTTQESAASLMGMSSLQGLQTAFQPSYGGTQGEKQTGIVLRLVESYFKSFSPSAGAQETRRQDPIQRKVSNNNDPVQDVTEYFQSRWPGASQSLPPNKTTLGQNKLNADGVVGQYANPYKSDVAPYTDAAAIITDLIDRTGDLSLAPSAPDKKVTGNDRKGVSQTLSIPAERYAKLQEDVGNEIIKKVSALSPTMSDEKKAEKLKDIYSTARENGRNKVKRELGLH